MSSLAKLLKLLNSETDPLQIGLGFCMAMIMGFSPLFSPHNLLVLLLALILRVNLSAFIVALAVWSALAFALDPMFSAVGLSVLTAGPLEGLFTALYSTSLGRLSGFNNTVVMGSLVVSLALFGPLLMVSMRSITAYRETILARVEHLRIVKLIKASRFYQIYQEVTPWTS